MSALYIPSLNRTHWKTQASICFVRPFYIKGTGDIFPLFIKILTSFEAKKFLLKSSTNFERFLSFSLVNLKTWRRKGLKLKFLEANLLEKSEPRKVYFTLSNLCQKARPFWK